MKRTILFLGLIVSGQITTSHAVEVSDDYLREKIRTFLAVEECNKSTTEQALAKKALEFIVMLKKNVDLGAHSCRFDRHITTEAFVWFVNIKNSSFEKVTKSLLYKREPLFVADRITWLLGEKPELFTFTPSRIIKDQHDYYKNTYFNLQRSGPACTSCVKNHIAFCELLKEDTLCSPEVQKVHSLLKRFYTPASMNTLMRYCYLLEEIFEYSLVFYISNMSNMQLPSDRSPTQQEFDNIIQSKLDQIFNVKYHVALENRCHKILFEELGCSDVYSKELASFEALTNYLEDTLGEMSSLDGVYPARMNCDKERLTQVVKANVKTLLNEEKKYLTTLRNSFPSRKVYTRDYSYKALRETLQYIHDNRAQPTHFDNFFGSLPNIFREDQ